MFSVYKRAIGDVEPFEFLPGAEGLALGSAAKLASGQLAKCEAADTAEYIVQGPKREDGCYQVIRVLPATIFETRAEAQIDAAKVGTDVQLNTTADGVTATGGGSFVVTETDEAASGGIVRGYFRAAAGAGG